MAERHVLAIDQGTTNSKVLLFNESGEVVARAARPVSISFPRPGWVEQDAGALWRSVEEAIDECLMHASGRRVDAIGVTNQRESVLLWDRATGQPVGPAIVWQCRRTAGFCEELRERGMQTLLEERTGLTIDPLFSASKLRWLLQDTPGAERRAAAGELCAGTIDSWVLWNLSGRSLHVCDVTNASRTQLLNLHTLHWDDELLALFDIPRAVLPAVKPSSGVFGESVARGQLAGGIPLASAIGDSHAALFGQAAFRPGSVKATYGTGSSLMTLVERPVRSHGGLSTTVAWALSDAASYALEGNITTTGGAVDWLGTFLRLRDAAAGVAELANSAADSGGVHLVPAFAGLGAPYWDADARGLLCGMTRGTTAAHVARATLESIAFQVRDVFEVMRDDAGAAATLLADGGASRNDTLMQIQADTLGLPVLRTDSADVSACGAAWLAGLAVGVWPSTSALEQLPRSVSSFEPHMPEGERERRYDGWKEAVARARLRPHAMTGED
jgi:glycerol kinase